MKKTRFLLLLLPLILFTSCFEDKDTKKKNPYSETDNGLYVLCEGTGTDNNSALSYFNFKDSTSVGDYFTEGLGKNANDMISVGDNLYITVTESACIWVINKKTGKAVKRIETIDSDGNNRMPRRLTYNDGYVYASCWDGNVIKISTTTNAIVANCPTNGRYPEGIAIANGKIYVANSGGKDYPNYDNTVAVIDMNTFSFEKHLTVLKNPQTVKAYENKVYVLSTGDYSSTYQLTVINNAEIEQQLQMNITDFDFWQNRMYFFYTSVYSSPSTKKEFNFSYLDINNMNAEPTIVQQYLVDGMVMPYHIIVMDNTIFVTDAKNFTSSGDVFALSTSGEILYKFPVLINPSKIVKK